MYRPKPGQIGYDCERCRRERIGTRGRDCVGVTISRGEFERQLLQKIEEHQTTNLEILCRRIGRGVCIKSFPASQLSLYLIDLVHLCKTFHTLPFEGALTDQPQIFFDALRVIDGETTRLQDEAEAVAV